jgi:hypothetical protein
MGRGRKKPRTDQPKEEEREMDSSRRSFLRKGVGLATAVAATTGLALAQETEAAKPNTPHLRLGILY